MKCFSGNPTVKYSMMNATAQVTCTWFNPVLASKGTANRYHCSAFLCLVRSMSQGIVCFKYARPGELADKGLLSVSTMTVSELAN